MHRLKHIIKRKRKRFCDILSDYKKRIHAKNIMSRTRDRMKIGIIKNGTNMHSQRTTRMEV